MSISSLGYVVIEAQDLRGWRDFGANVLGLMPGDQTTSGALTFRVDERPFRILIKKGAADRFIAAGWEFSSPQSFHAQVATLINAGVKVVMGSPEEAKGCYAQELARCCDPCGNQMELYYGRQYDYVPFSSPAQVSGFVAGDLGLGHVVLPAPQLEKMRSFYKAMLGFEDTDQARFYFSTDAADPGLGFYFLHCGNPRHHSLALGEMPAESGLVHLMIEVKDMDDVGRALDRAEKAGAHISSSLGKHTNDRMVSFYVRSPSGFDIEYGCQGWQVDWSSFVPTTSLRDSVWGHHWRQ